MAKYQEVIYDSGELESATTSVTISDLDGDTDIEYELIIRVIHGSNSIIKVRPNNDTGTNYGHQYLAGVNTTISAARDTADTAMEINRDGSTNNISFIKLILYAKSGFVRTGISKGCDDVTGTTIERVHIHGHTWNNTADNITSLVVYATDTDGLGIGTRIILLRKTTVADANSWSQVYSGTLTETATSVTISNLTGNTDVLYRVRYRIVNAYNGANFFMLHPNNDETASTKGYQTIKATNTTGSADRATSQTSWTITGWNYGDTVLNDILIGEILLYAKAGYSRIMISNVLEGIATTTIDYAVFFGQNWSNTADEITSLVLDSYAASGLGIGTFVELDKLVL